MKILILSARDIKHPWAGGAEVNIHEMVKYWIKEGHEVTMFCAQHYGSKKKAKNEEIIDGMKVIRKGGRFTIYLIAPFYYWFRLRKFTDVILDIDYGIPFFSPFFADKPVIGIVNHIHGFTYFIEEKFPINYIGYFLETRVMPFIYGRKNIIAISNTTRNQLMTLGVPRKNINVINPGIDHKQYTPGKKKFKKPTVIYVGRVRLYKRVDLLITAFKNIINEMPTARLYIIGEGNDRKRLERLVKKNKLTKHVFFLGFVSHNKKIKTLQRSWVFVTPSAIEGWGMTVIEANASGVPVVAFDVPGLKDSIKHLKTGVLVKSNEEMEKAIKKILKDVRFRTKLTSESIRWAKTFDWQKSAKEHIKILEREIK